MSDTNTDNEVVQAMKPSEIIGIVAATHTTGTAAAGSVSRLIINYQTESFGKFLIIYSLYKLYKSNLF